MNGTLITWPDNPLRQLLLFSIDGTAVSVEVVRSESEAEIWTWERTDRFQEDSGKPIMILYGGTLEIPYAVLRQIRTEPSGTIGYTP